MKRFLRGMAFALSCLYICTYAMAGYAAPNVDCTPFTINGPTDSTPYSQGCGSTQSWELTTLYKTEIRTIKWPDGHTENNVRASSTGACVLIHPKCHTDLDLGFCTPPEFNDPSDSCYRIKWECWPEFFDPTYLSNGHYEQVLWRRGAPVTTQGCGFPYWDHKDLYGEDRCTRASRADTEDTKRDHSCSGGGTGGEQCTLCQQSVECFGCYYESYCFMGYCEAYTPILIDIKGNGYEMTGAAGGVPFDFMRTGSRTPLS